MTEILDIRMTLSEATIYLITRDRCSSQEAWEWIQQEARAKRAKLYEVALAVVQERPIQYQYSVPI